MLLLAADTSGRNGSIALAEAQPGQGAVDVLQVVFLDGGAFSAQLVPELASLLQSHGPGRTKRDLSAFAVVTGPGSFTGLRVGLAAIKALADTLQKPIVAISLLEALARSSGNPGRVLAILDAGRNELYVGDYDLVDPKTAQLNCERVMTPPEFLARIRDAKFPISEIVTSDEEVAKSLILMDGSIAVRLVDYPDAGVIAQYGWERLERGETVSVEGLEANYLRHSIASKPKAG